MSLVEAAPRRSDPAPVIPRVGRLMRGPALFGIVTILGFFGAFGYWAATAPLSSGTIASGVVGPNEKTPVVQHREGGIVSTIHVREGELVEKGQLLISLDATQAQANYDALRKDWLRLQVRLARIEAQTVGAERVTLPPEAASETSPELKDFVDAQLRLFEVRRNTLDQQAEIYQRQQEQLRSEIAAIVAENTGLSTQMQLVQDEFGDKSSLLASQLISRSDVQSLERELARLASVIASNEARMLRAEQSIEENKLKILQMQEAFRDQVAQENTDVNNQIAQTDEKLIAAADILRRTQIHSPAAGRVQNLQFTSDGVIGAGAKIMDIVPSDGDFIVLARLQPKDRSAVDAGLAAHLTLVPFANRNALPLNGIVEEVAADTVADERTNLPYYEVRVRVPAEEVAKHEGMYMAPGMPADVTIVTGERTMVQYLAEPFLRSFRNAFVYD